MAFYVGQKVTRKIAAPWVNVSTGAIAQGFSFPEPKRVYTIRAIKDFGPSHGCGLTFVEIRNQPIEGEEPHFQGTCFRPVVERKTDISIFTAMLTPKKVTEAA